MKFSNLTSVLVLSFAAFCLTSCSKNSPSSQPGFSKSTEDYQEEINQRIKKVPPTDIFPGSSAAYFLRPRWREIEFKTKSSRYKLKSYAWVNCADSKKPSSCAEIELFSINDANYHARVTTSAGTSSFDPRRGAIVQPQHISISLVNADKSARHVSSKVKPEIRSAYFNDEELKKFNHADSVLAFRKCRTSLKANLKSQSDSNQTSALYIRNFSFFDRSSGSYSTNRIFLVWDWSTSSPARFEELNIAPKSQTILAGALASRPEEVIFQYSPSTGDNQPWSDNLLKNRTYLRYFSYICQVAHSEQQRRPTSAVGHSLESRWKFGFKPDVIGNVPVLEVEAGFIRNEESELYRWFLPAEALSVNAAAEHYSRALPQLQSLQ